MRLLLSYLFVHAILSQEIVGEYPVNLNSNEWIAWDAKEGSFIVFDSTIKIWTNCTLGELSDTCTSWSSGYGVDLILFTADFLFIIDYKNKDIMRKTISSRDKTDNQPINHYPLPTNYDFGYRSVAATDSYFYLYQLVGNKRILNIYGNDWATLKFNHSLPSLVGRLDDKSTGWFIKKDGIYTFDNTVDSTLLSKRTSDGLTEIWKSQVPLCGSSSTLLIASCSPLVYTVCSPQNIINQFSSESGKLFSGVHIREGRIANIECSSSGLFILYDNSNVDQYGCDLTFLYTYSVDNKKILPFFSDIKIASGFLLYILCDPNSQTNCYSPKIYKLKTITNLTSCINNIESTLFSTTAIQKSSKHINYTSVFPQYTPIYDPQSSSSDNDHLVVIVSITITTLLILCAIVVLLRNRRYNINTQQRQSRRRITPRH
jgi:hypothetical protein